MSPTSTRTTASAMSIFGVVSLFIATSHAFPSAYMDPFLEERAAPEYNGCYSSSDPMTEFGTWAYQSTGYCAGNCTSKNAPVLGLTNGNDCWCGSQLPALNSKVDDSKCNVGCTGYGQVSCGGNGFWSVYLTGIDDSVGNVGGSSSSSSTSSTSATSTTSTSAASTSAAVVTSVAPGTTVVVTQPADHSATSSAEKTTSSHSSNTAAIAAGVVVGIVAFGAIVLAVYLLLRRRQRKLAEEDYKRSTQVQDFMRSTSKPPGTSYSAASDQRLDPIVGRRNSVGSMADNQDYSRRILRVANPDGH